jgi:3-methyladenine DNA glycosylase AlkD
VTAWSSAYLERLTPALEARADADKAKGMAAYMRNRFPFLGVQGPGRREAMAAARADLPQPSEADLTDLVRALWRLDAREYQYVGSDEIWRAAGRCGPSFLTVIEWVITARSWWDTVDRLAVHGAGVLVANHSALRTEMDRWLDDDDLWLRRSALLHQLLWRDRTDAAWLFAACERRAGETEFFIRKAIGWVLREYSKTDASAVRGFVAAHEVDLSPLSRREALAWLDKGAARR